MARRPRVLAASVGTGTRPRALARRADDQILRLQRWIRAEPLLHRLTVGTRILLAVGFIPTGMVKLLGRRFAYMDPATPLGGFFETLYQSGLWWQFLGGGQVLAGVLLLVPATSTLGALLFAPIIANVFVITLSYDFNATPVITSLMTLASAYLLLWDYDRLRGLFGVPPERLVAVEPFPTMALRPLERGIYVLGAAAGFGFFGYVRGFALPFLPPGSGRLLAALCVLSALAAVGVGLTSAARSRGPRPVAQNPG